MNLFLWNILLAVIWAFVMSQVNATGLAVGFVIGYVVLLFTKPLLPPSRYFDGLFRAIGLVIYFLVELVKSGVRVAIDVLRPNCEANVNAAVFAIPLDVKNEGQITLLANCISLTPGTLSLDVSDDRTTLFVHGMYVHDEEESAREIKEGFERKILEVTGD